MSNIPLFFPSESLSMDKEPPMTNKSLVTIPVSVYNVSPIWIFFPLGSYIETLSEVDKVIGPVTFPPVFRR
jgi:hypothetical protein